MFDSAFHKAGEVGLPQFSGVRVMMLPIMIGDLQSVPNDLVNWSSTLSEMFGMCKHHGEVGYLTIDEKTVAPASTHRRSGRHVDGVYQGRCGGWGGGGGGWGSVGNGMLTVSSHAGCRAWNQSFDGFPGWEGECDHLAVQCRDDSETIFAPGTVYWLDGLCVHESLPMTVETKRQFVRLSLPSNAPWFDGYTANPKGVLPTGPILPRRQFMNA
jgi:hypothetical protein